MRIGVLALLVLATGSLCAQEAKTELGEINGAKFRIDVPANWNGSLVMYCHGYGQGLPTGQPPLRPQSAYSAPGWAVKEAMEDTENLRQYFARKYGKPKRTFVTGHSMGGDPERTNVRAGGNAFSNEDTIYYESTKAPATSM